MLCNDDELLEQYLDRANEHDSFAVTSYMTPYKEIDSAIQSFFKFIRLKRFSHSFEVFKITLQNLPNIFNSLSAGCGVYST